MRSTLIALVMALPLAAQTPKSLVVSNPNPPAGDTTDHVDLRPTGTAVLGAQVLDSAGRAIPVTRRPKVYWYSGNPTIASVDLTSGKITAKRVGYATIYAVTASPRLVAQARACVVPAARTELDPKPMKVTVTPGRDLGSPPSLRVGDTAQFQMRVAMQADDTTRLNLDSWGPCVHWVINGGPAYPRIPNPSEIMVDRRGTVFLKCCLPAIYLSASVGLTPPPPRVYFTPATGRPGLRIAQAPLPWATGKQ